VEGRCAALRAASKHLVLPCLVRGYTSGALRAANLPSTLTLHPQPCTIAGTYFSSDAVMSNVANTMRPATMNGGPDP
jgi:hypothetical protein